MKLQKIDQDQYGLMYNKYQNSWIDINELSNFSQEK